MYALLNAAIEHIWSQIAGLDGLTTPDDRAARAFTITAVSQGAVEIATEAGSPLAIRRAAFVETLHYLVANHHVDSNPCEIRSSQLSELSGPLCAATRAVNGNTRVINYIVPILEAVGILGSSGVRRNTTWLC